VHDDGGGGCRRRRFRSVVERRALSALWVAPTAVHAMTFTSILIGVGTAVVSRIVVATWWDGSAAARHSRARLLRWWNRRA
jgi:hypothetical protein